MDPMILSVAEVLRRDLLVPYFQPVLSARQRTIMGVEALARAPLPNGLVLDAEWLFSRAAAEDLVAELDRRCCEKAVERFASARRRDDHILLLNLGSWVMSGGETVVQTLVDLVERYDVRPAQIGVEILEAKIDDITRVRTLVRELRRAGFLLALDDIGAGYSNLDRIALLKPDVLKVDRSLIAGIDNDFHKQETLKSLVGLSRKIGALVIAEGLETETEAMAALEFGADLLQGYLLGRPDRDATIFCDAPTDITRGIEALALKFKSYMVRKINYRKLQHRRYNIVLNEVLCHLANANVDDFDALLENAIRRYPNVECFYVLDGAGIQITDTIWNPAMRRREAGAMFRPAPRGADHSLKEYYYILLDVELQKYTTDPYVSFASGNLSRTISTYFRDAQNNTLYVLCIDVLADD
jgi:EAL domain-containing protein (putative c-di-GMP-specific phosphodiesterase class I)